MAHMQGELGYRPNPKHKRGCAGEGPPRWFPSSASLCPDDLNAKDAQALLESSIEARDDAHPNAKARISLDGQGRFFKAYSEDGGRTWHGYPVQQELVRRQIPTKVLRELYRQGRLSHGDYKKLLGGAR
jgi:hypothetical protein